MSSKNIFLFFEKYLWGNKLLDKNKLALQQNRA